MWLCLLLRVVVIIIIIIIIICDFVNDVSSLSGIAKIFRLRYVHSPYLLTYLLTFSVCEVICKPITTV